MAALRSKCLMLAFIEIFIIYKVRNVLESRSPVVLESWGIGVSYMRCVEELTILINKSLNVFDII